MNPERWQRIEQLYNSALALEPGQRDSFLKEACAGDESLRREVESLLACQSKVEALCESPAMEVAARDLAREQAGDVSGTLAGRTLSHYKILEKLGAGGMGIVYKAFDARLNRPVALKVLPPERISDPERKRRFVKEARAASALNHPNIIAIYDIISEDGCDFIVMEYVAGQTLSQKIGRKGMKLDDVLKHAIQIADALIAAHNAGIIHRDLKPANILVTEDGRVKVLDFGLAKLTQPEPEDESNIASSMAPQTEEGRIMGTAAYMSPEQVQAKAVDARSDIFSFGSVLYEMVTGRRAFEGDSNLSTLSAVLNHEPKPAHEIIDSLPHEIEHLIERCLRKDPARRWQHMSDLKVALQDLLEQSDSGKLRGAEGAQLQPKVRRWWVVAVAVVAVAALIGATWYLARSKPDLSPAQMAASPLTAYPGEELYPSFSPDGSQISFSWNRDGNTDIYVKIVDTAAEPLRLTSDPAPDLWPRYSPHGQWIAFTHRESSSEGTSYKLILISPLGGTERDLASVGFEGIDWTPDARFIVATARMAGGFPGQLVLVSSSTGEITPIAYPRGTGGLWDAYPAMSPDGKRIAFSRTTSTSSELLVIPVEGGAVRRLVRGVGLFSGLAWTPDGKEIVFSTLNAAGGLRRIAAEAPEGTVPQPAGGGEDGQYPAFGSAGSRRGLRLAFSRLIPDTDMMRVELSGGGRLLGEAVPIARTTRQEQSPQISTDDKRIVFASDRTGAFEVWVSLSDGSNPSKLTSFPDSFSGSPRWRSDGRLIVFDRRDNEGNADIYTVPADGGPVLRLTAEPSIEARPCFSPDGRWIYFRSDMSGDRRYYRMSADGRPHPATTWQPVTSSGAVEAFPSWDGNFLYFTRASGGGVFSVPAEGGPEKKAIDGGQPGSWCVAEQAIYYLYTHSGITWTGIYLDTRSGPTPVMRFDIKTGVTTRVGAISGRVDANSGGIAVSRDERFLVYVQRNQSDADLMLVENFR